MQRRGGRPDDGRGWEGRKQRREARADGSGASAPGSGASAWVRGERAWVLVVFSLGFSYKPKKKLLFRGFRL